MRVTDVEAVAAWVAPVATMIAAVMTAANLGARVTGWGFVVFVIGSVSWSIVGISSGQSNLLWTNAFLTFVNVIGVWRWLGRQAKYEDGGQQRQRGAHGRVCQRSFQPHRSLGARLQGPMAGQSG